MKQSRRPGIEDYVGTLAARVNLPASIVKAAVELLEKNRRLLFGKNPWVSAAAALWLASFRRFGLLKEAVEALGVRYDWRVWPRLLEGEVEVRGGVAAITPRGRWILELTGEEVAKYVKKWLGVEV